MPYVTAVESGVSSVVSSATSKIVHDAMLGDACIFIANYASDKNASTFDMAACRSYGSGVLRQGIIAMLDLWYQAAYLTVRGEGW